MEIALATLIRKIKINNVKPYVYYKTMGLTLKTS